jgi:hypothetical protein
MLGFYKIYKNCKSMRRKLFMAKKLAAVGVAKCPKSGNIYGVRIEESV